MFDRISEHISRQVAQPWFFLLVAVALLAWIPTVFLWDTGTSDLLVDALTNPLSLLLLVLLQNSQYRSGRAKDDRQDELEKALALLLRQVASGEADEARRDRLHEQAARLVHNAEVTGRLVSGDIEH